MAALSSSDAEVRFRAKRILSEVVEADFQRRLSAFSADIDGKQGLTMPGCRHLRKLWGAIARLEIYSSKCNRPEGHSSRLMNKVLSRAAEKLREELASEPAVIGRAANSRSQSKTTGSDDHQHLEFRIYAGVVVRGRGQRCAAK